VRANWLACLSLWAAALPLAAQNDLLEEGDYAHIRPSPDQFDTTGFALVLGGGGARGLAHVGVLRVLEEEGLRPNLIVGTSMGAVLGALYASGYSAAEIERLVLDRAWLSLFLDEREPADRLQGGRSTLEHHQLTLQLDRWPPSAPAGASYGQAVEDLVGRLCADAVYLAAGEFDRLPIPFRCVSTDVVAAAPFVSERGALARAVRASGSIPLIFVPVQFEGRTLLDGGLVDNLPVEVARRLGFSRILAVDVSNIFLPYEGNTDDFGALVQRVSQLAQRAQNYVVERPGEILLRVDVIEHNALSFWSAASIIGSGYRDADAIRDRLRGLPPQIQAAPPRPQVGPVRIRRLLVSGNDRMSAWSIRRRLGVSPGDRLELEQLWRRASELARLSFFHHVWLDAVPAAGEPGAADVTLHVIERSKPSLELGAHYITDDGGAALLRLRLDNAFGLGGGHALSLRLGENDLGARARSSQALRGSRRVEAQQSLHWRREWVDLREDDERIDTAVLERRGGDVALHVRPLGRGWTWQLGLSVEAVESYRVAARDLSHSEDRLYAFTAAIESGLPGGLSLARPDGFRLRWRNSLDFGGANVELWQLEGGIAQRINLWSKWGINGRAGLAVGSEDVPFAYQGRAGGPQGWAGWRRDGVVAAQLGWARLGLSYEFRPELRLELAAAQGWAGNTWPRAAGRLGGGAQVIFDSFAGPIRVGVQGARGGPSQAVVQVGYEF
jgi:NTE family protein